jgi:hypothetical protein
MIFINYRREDSAATAGRLHDRLAQVFGRKRIFMDVDQIPAGIDFVAHLNSQVAACNVLLVLIGPHWLNVNEAGERRLHQPDDFVAIEIAAALARDIRVIPVLVDGAIIPKASELPDSLKPLVRRQAIDLRQAHFGRDAEALIERVREALGDKAGLGRWRVRALAGAAAIAALLLIGVGGYVFFGHIVELGVQRAELKLEEERKAAEAEANRKVMENQAEQERQAKAAQEAEAKRKADEAEQQRLAVVKAEQERQAKAAQEAEAMARAIGAQAPAARQTAGANTPTTVASSLFTKRINTEISRGDFVSSVSASVDDCAQICANDATCKAYSYNKPNRSCYIYHLLKFDLVANGNFDSGIRQPDASENPRGWVGVRIQVVTDAVAEALNIAPARGALVAGVDDKGPAQLAGIQPADVVVSFDGHDIKELGDLPRAVADTPVGKVVDVVVIRKGKQETHKVTVGRLQGNEKGANVPTTVASTLFTRRTNVEGSPESLASVARAASTIDECERVCAGFPVCKAYSYRRTDRLCYMYSNADFVPNDNYDSGIRQPDASTELPDVPPGSPMQKFFDQFFKNRPATVASSLFERRTNVEGSWKSLTDVRRAASTIDECEQVCAGLPVCKAYSYRRTDRLCYMYSNADFVPNDNYDSGIRK